MNTVTFGTDCDFLALLEITLKKDWKKLTRHPQNIRDCDLTLHAQISKNYVIFIISNKKTFILFSRP